MTAPFDEGGGSTGDPYDRAPCGLLTTAANGTIRRANRTLCALLDYTADELVGRRLQDLLTVGGRIFHQTHWMPLLQLQGSVAEVQLEVVHRDGRAIPVIVNAVQYVDGAEAHHEVALFVATDRRRYERELLQARRRAEELLASERDAQRALAEALRAQEREAQQRAVLAEQLVGIVSHDLRTPLSAVVLGADLLGMSGVSAAQARTVERIVSAAGRANRLIADLLDFTQARLGGGLRVTPAPVDLHALVAGCVDELRLAWEGRRVEHVARGPGAVVADGDRLAQVVTNLANNALTYGAPDHAVRLTSAVDGAALTIEVHNAGPAIPAELVPHLFEPLRRGEQQVKMGSRSVGLGLYIVQQIVAAHAGEVTVRSTPADGTTFTVRAPARPSA